MPSQLKRYTFTSSPFPISLFVITYPSTTQERGDAEIIAVLYSLSNNFISRPYPMAVLFTIFTKRTYSKPFFRHHNILIYCKLMHCPWHICEISSRNYFKSSESSCWFAWKCKNRSVIHNTDSKGFSRSDCDPVEYCFSRLSNDISNKIPFTYRDTTCRKY